MRFKTASGAVYDLYEVEGETYATRDAEHSVTNRQTDAPMEKIHGMRLIRWSEPKVGEIFSADTATHGYLTTTRIVEVTLDTTTRYPGDPE
jgi:hypothetical protein